MAGGRRPNSPVPAFPPDNDDMLMEIFLRLPPAPSSLPRASLVCKRWRHLISNPDFLRLFRARHCHNAPLVGFFAQGSRGICFAPALEPPDRIPGAAFSFLERLSAGQILCCRHGLLLVFIPTRLMVWDLSDGYLSQLSVPLGIDCWTAGFNGMVFRDEGDAHGDEHFQVVMVRTNTTGAFACVYSSKTDEWGKPILTACPSSMLLSPTPGTKVGRSLYWALYGNSHDILEFDLDNQCLTVIDVALSLPNIYCKFWVMALDDGLLGYIFQSVDHKIQLWKRNADCDGDSGWVLEKSIDQHELLRQSSYDVLPAKIVGIAEECNVFFPPDKEWCIQGHYRLNAVQEGFRVIRHLCMHSFTSVYTAGNCLLIHCRGITCSMGWPFMSLSAKN